MKELNSHLILAAGSSSRFRNTFNKNSLETQNKFLFPFLNAEEGCLVRLIEQIHENFNNDKIFLALRYEDKATINFLKANGIDYVEIIFLKLKFSDNNSVSLLNLLKRFTFDKFKNFFIWEADIFLEHKLINKVKSFINLKNFDIVSTTYIDIPEIKEGGFLTSANLENKNYKKNLVYIGKKRNQNHSKLFGVTVISHSYLKKFLINLSSLVINSPDQYFHYAFINEKDLDLLELLLDDGIAFSFNTKEQLQNGIDQLIKNFQNYKIKLIPLSNLKHIELFSNKRVEWLKNKIIKEKKWNRPIIIDAGTGFIMDGQHRFEVAKSLNFIYVPCVELSYKDIDCWSLRDQFKFNSENIIKIANELSPFPYKTVKHDLDRIKWNNCEYSLEDLR